MNIKENGKRLTRNYYQFRKLPIINKVQLSNLRQKRARLKKLEESKRLKAVILFNY